MKVRVWKIMLYGSPTGEYYFSELPANEAVRLMNDYWGGKDRPYRVKMGYIEKKE